MEIDDIEIVHLELKYCEHCGGLWLRQKGNAEIYCAACIPYVAQLANSSERGRRPRLPIKPRLRIEGKDGEILLCGEGGNA